MEIGPILRAMTRNKLGVVLIALQIAFTMTVIINAVFIINERSRLMARPSGLDEANLFFLSSIGFGDNFNEEIAIADDMALLRQTPGIVGASVINAVPLTSSGSGTGVRLSPDETQPAMFGAIYRTDEQIIDTMDLQLVAGEGFSATDVRSRQSNESTPATKTIITEAFAGLPHSIRSNCAGLPLHISGEAHRRPAEDTYPQQIRTFDYHFAHHIHQDHPVDCLCKRGAHKGDQQKTGSFILGERLLPCADCRHPRYSGAERRADCC